MECEGQLMTLDELQDILGLLISNSYTKIEINTQILTSTADTPLVIAPSLSNGLQELHPLLHNLDRVDFGNLIGTLDSMPHLETLSLESCLLCSEVMATAGG
ncbi:hypothetical protein FS749_012751 [Ceratobasidium sp. UAMH 11750]|nr:hypothetical protein FS749_012751 [Ceratobasidium sp. UAMH 11750]